MIEVAPSQRVALLVVEDESLIASVLEDALDAAGFSVMLASDGAEALECLEEHGRELVALVTDIRLGAGPSGWEVANHACTLNKEISVVYTSGDSGHEWRTRGVTYSAFIQKPYTTDQIVTAITTLINRTG